MTVRIRVSRGIDTKNSPCLHFDGLEGPIFEIGITPDSVDAEVRAFRELAHHLVRAGCTNGGLRGNLDILPNSRRLRRLLFGEESLCARWPFRKSYLLDLDEYSTPIPWELVEGRYVHCSDPDHGWSDGLGLVPPCTCPEGHWTLPLQEPLSLLKQLGARCLPRQQPQSSIAPTKVLLLGDAEVDKEEHLPKLQAELGKAFQVRFYSLEMASRATVLDAFYSPDYALIYLFGHSSELESGKSRAGFRISNGQSVSTDDLKQPLPGRPLVFLNSCWLGQDRWSETEGANSSMATTLLQRGALAVVTPVGPHVPSQAGRAALTFCLELMKASTIGHALHQVRVDSFGEYNKQSADVSWFLYRLHGDPQKLLPTTLWDEDANLRGPVLELGGTRLAKKVDAATQQIQKIPFSLKGWLEAIGRLDPSRASPRFSPGWFGGHIRTAFERFLQVWTSGATVGFSLYQVDQDSKEVLKDLVVKLYQRDLRRLLPVDILDACISSAGGWKHYAENINKKLLGVALDIAGHLTPTSEGATFLVNEAIRIWLTSHVWIKTALLTSLLRHPLVVGLSLDHKKWLERLESQVVSITEERETFEEAKDFLERLLKRAQEINGGRPPNDRAFLDAFFESLL